MATNSRPLPLSSVLTLTLVSFARLANSQQAAEAGSAGKVGSVSAAGAAAAAGAAGGIQYITLPSQPLAPAGGLLLPKSPTGTPGKLHLASPLRPSNDIPAIKRALPPTLAATAIPGAGIGPAGQKSGVGAARTEGGLGGGLGGASEANYKFPPIPAAAYKFAAYQSPNFEISPLALSPAVSRTIALRQLEDELADLRSQKEAADGMASMGGALGHDYRGGGEEARARALETSADLKVRIADKKTELDRVKTGKKTIGRIITELERHRDELDLASETAPNSRVEERHLRAIDAIVSDLKSGKKLTTVMREIKRQRDALRREAEALRFLAPDAIKMRKAATDLDLILSDLNGKTNAPRAAKPTAVPGDQVDAASKSPSPHTLKFDSGLQASGKLKDATKPNTGDGPVGYLQFTGPTQLSYNNTELAGQGASYHSSGFGMPLGRLKGGDKPLRRYSEEDLKGIGVVPGGWVTLRFQSDVVLTGKLKGATRAANGSLLLLTFTEALVTWEGRTLFKPTWGTYDMGVGEEITSVSAGAADKAAYSASTAIK